MLYGHVMYTLTLIQATYDGFVILEQKKKLKSNEAGNTSKYTLLKDAISIVSIHGTFVNWLAVDGKKKVL